MAIPREIRPSGERGMCILWDDGQESIFSFPFLRKNCPCATCRKMREELAERNRGPQYQLRLITPDSPPEDPLLVQVDWVGNYALKLTWKDGHDSGIYPFDLLSELKEEAPSP